MLLKSVTTFGFKSFADKIEFTFSPGITAVVGPNGSGKSNVSDAVRWVLGEQSAKYLRGSKMEDVIFNGTAQRRPLGVAEVELVFDNTDHSLPLEYDEVSIVRRLFRSGDSEYQLNKKSCRLKDIVDLLADTGLGRGSMSLIGQNKIDEILNARPEERRNIFEEAAGIAKYRLRKKEATRRLEDTAGNLLRINDIKSEVEAQLTPLQAEAEKAAKHKRLTAERRTYGLTLAVLRMEQLQQNQNDLTALYASTQNAVATARAEVGKHEANLTETQQQIDNLNDKYSALQDAVKEKETALEKLRGDQAVLEERVLQSKKQIESLERRCERTESQVKNWQEQIVSLGDEYDRIEESRAQAALQVKRLTQERTECERAVADGEKNLTELREGNFEGVRQLVELRNARVALEREQEQRRLRRENLKETIAALELRIEEFSREQAELSNECAETQQNLQQYQTESEELQRKFDEQKNKLREAEKKEFELNKQSTGSEAKLNALERLQKDYEGFGYGVRLVMHAQTSWRSEILGVAAELLHVPDEYTAAIETALGAAAQNIVVRSACAAKSAIEFLKRQRGGRATFLPLDIIQDRGITQAERRLLYLPDICGVASELVECGAEVRPAISFLLGRVLVAKNLDTALAAAREGNFRLRVVTLDGDVVNKGGSLTGGSRKQNENGFLSREREIRTLRETLKTLRHCRLELLEEREKEEAARDEIKRRQGELTERIQKRQVRLAELKAQIKNLQEQLGEHNERLALTVSDRGILTREFLTARDELLKLKPKLEEKERQNSEAAQRLNELLLGIKRSQGALESLRTRLEDARLQEKSFAIRAEEKNERMQALDAELGRLQESIAHDEQEQERLRSVVDGSADESKKLDEHKTELMRLLQDIVSGREDFSARRRELLQQKQDEQEMLSKAQQKLNVAEGKNSAGRIELARLESDLTHAAEEIDKGYGLTPEEARVEFSGFAPAVAELSSAELRARLAALNREIGALGQVNLQAEEQYAATRERYDFLEKQYADLVTARQNLENVISQINSGMATRFGEAFRRINVFFAETYVKLFGGGTALLKLADPGDVLESGINIEVQPPGKRLQSLFLQSGGERALTVIALLFALLSYKPSPFCILDEIDAPLDDANIERFSNFLRDYSQHTQFIVITHRKGTMEAADVMYGITMEESGVSKLLSVKMSGKETRT